MFLNSFLAYACGVNRGDSVSSKILRDRLYRSRSSQMCLKALGKAPEFPFTMTTVNKSQASATTASRQRQQQQQQSRYTQQATYTQQQSNTTSVAQSSVSLCYVVFHAFFFLPFPHVCLLLLRLPSFRQDGWLYKIPLVETHITRIKVQERPHGKCRKQQLRPQPRLHRRPKCKTLNRLNQRRTRHHLRRILNSPLSMGMGL